MRGVANHFGGLQQGGFVTDQPAGRSAARYRGCRQSSRPQGEQPFGGGAGVTRKCQCSMPIKQADRVLHIRQVVDGLQAGGKTSPGGQRAQRAIKSASRTQMELPRHWPGHPPGGTVVAEGGRPASKRSLARRQPQRQAPPKRRCQSTPSGAHAFVIDSEQHPVQPKADLHKSAINSIAGAANLSLQQVETKPAEIIDTAPSPESARTGRPRCSGAGMAVSRRGRPPRSSQKPSAQRQKPAPVLGFG